MTIVEMSYASLATWALAAILFRSYPAAWLMRVVQGQRQMRESRLWLALWQLQHGCVYVAGYAKDPERVERPRDLTTDERATAQAIAQGRHWPLVGLRLAEYFLSCPLCHHFWAAWILLRGNLSAVLVCVTVATGLHVLVFGAGSQQAGSSGSCGASRAAQQHGRL